MQFESALPEAALRIWRLRLCAVAVSVTVWLCFLSLSAAVVCAAVFIAIIFVWLPFFIKSFKISLKGGILLVACGIIFRTTRILPTKKAVYIKLYKTPLGSAAGLSAVVIRTVKGFIIIPEICDNYAEILRKSIEEA